MPLRTKAYQKLHQSAQESKRKVLQNLGGKDAKELIEIIEGHLDHDSYRENSLNMFKRSMLCQARDKGESFSKAYNRFAIDKVNGNSGKRALKSLAVVPLYAVATALALTGVALPAAVAVSIGATGISGVAEAREKRNIAAIGHGQEHIAQAQVKAIRELYADLDKKGLLNDNASSNIKDVLGIKNRSGIGSKVARYSSYISGPALAGARFLYSRLAGLSKTATFNVVAGIFAPVMPLVNTGASYAAARLRQRSIRNNSEKFEKIVEELFNPDNYTNPDEVDFDDLRESFKTKIEHHHCGSKQKVGDKSKSGNLKKTFLQGDKNTNIRKLISLPNWIGNKIRGEIPAPEKLGTEDLTTEPAGFNKYVNNCSRYRQDNDNIHKERRNLPTPNPVKQRIKPNYLNHFANMSLAGKCDDDILKEIANIPLRHRADLSKIHAVRKEIAAEKRDINAKIYQENDLDSRDFLSPQRYGGIGVSMKYPPDYDDSAKSWIFIIKKIARNGPAYNAGMKIGDTITVNGVNTKPGLKEAINQLRNDGLKNINSAMILNHKGNFQLDGFGVEISSQTARNA